MIYRWSLTDTENHGESRTLKNSSSNCQSTQETTKNGELPKNIIFAIPTLKTGGAEKFVVEMALRLNAEKFKAAVLVTRGGVDDFNVKILKRAGIEVIVIGNKSVISSIIASARVLKARRPDVIHTNIGSLMHVFLGVFLLKKSSRRIHTLHNIAGFAEQGIRLVIVKSILKFQKFRLVSISNAVQKSASEKFNISVKNIPLIPNGVDTEKFAPTHDKYLDEREFIRFVAVGSLSPVKSHEDLIESFSKITPDIRDRCHLDIVGDGSLHCQLEGLINSLHLEDSVSLLGNRTDIPEILRSSDVFVSSSKSEGFPLSLLEGMATGLPVLVTSVGGVVDIVRDKVDGILVQTHDISKLANHMELLAVNKILRHEYGMNSRLRAESFSWDRCVSSYSNLYVDSSAGKQYEG